MNNMNNQFAEMMKSFMNPEMFMSYTKNMQAMDFSGFTNMLRQNAEVFSSTNQMAAENAQSIIRRSAEVFGNNASNMFNAIRDVTSAGDYEQAAVCQQRYLKNSFEDNLNNTKEIIEMATKSSMEVFQNLGNNIAENMNKIFDNKGNKN